MITRFVVKILGYKMSGSLPNIGWKQLVKDDMAQIFLKSQKNRDRLIFIIFLPRVYEDTKNNFYSAWSSTFNCIYSKGQLNFLYFFSQWPCKCCNKMLTYLTLIIEFVL
jgi:hypothetical protein